MNFAEYINSIITRLVTSGRVSTVDDESLFQPSQENKPSSVSPFKWGDVNKYITSGFPKAWNVKVSYVGQTNSMEPSIDYGDAAILIPYSLFKSRMGTAQVGQICVYGVNGFRVIHRIVGKTSNGKFIFRGDNNYLPDPLVNESQIEDVVIGIVSTRDKIDDKQD